MYHANVCAITELGGNEMSEKRVLKKVKHRQPKLEIPEDKPKKEPLNRMDKVRLATEMPRALRDEFKLAVECNGDKMTEVLTEHIKYYIRQTRRKNAHFNEAYLERKKEEKK